ncbi:centriolar coiled-coil protein of 110 kDa [Chironomus tepperi]|uniref:centriolar coiled-coil protein of 110 kDa n=1 Tax=Chironomus tepperi TaxID=113505 RepID=UPI00391F7C5B
MQNNQFVSIFKIKNKPIIPPLITEGLRQEILDIRNQCKMKEEKIKQRKDLVNYSRKAEEERCSSANSYTISNPVFPVSQLPEAFDKADSDKETINEDASSIQTEFNEEQRAKETEFNQNSCELFRPDLKNQMKNLIDKQKQEYLKTMNVLKNKFIVEQQQLFMKLQNDMKNLTSTPLTNNSINLTEDEEFTEFQTCLQSFDKTGSEKTLINEVDQKKKAATKINAYARGYFVRRLIKTIYVQELIKNIQDTLHFVFSLNQHKLGGSPVQDILLKTKLFKQLQSDLHRFNDIFHQYSAKERMRIIANDREFRRRKIVEKRMEYLNRSF